MTENELKKLNRSELLQLLIAQTQRSEELEAELENVKKQLSEKEIKINESGSLAEASLKLNGVFEAAQQAAEQYLENIKILQERQDEICAQREEESRKKADEMIQEAEKKCYEKKLEADVYWNMISDKLEKFYDEHVGLRELLSTATRKINHDENGN